MEWIIRNWKLLAIVAIIIVVAWLVPEVFRDLFNTAKTVSDNLGDVGKSVGQGIAGK